VNNCTSLFAEFGIVRKNADLDLAGYFYGALALLDEICDKGT